MPQLMPMKALNHLGVKRSRSYKEDNFPAPKRQRLNAHKLSMPCTVPIMTPTQPQQPLILRPNPKTCHCRIPTPYFNTNYNALKLEPHPTRRNTNVISLISDNNDKETPIKYKCDKKGYIQFKKGLIVANKYKMQKQLGKGTFSRVFECQYNNMKYAVKIIRNSYKYQCAAETELAVLRRIRSNDPSNESCCIHIVESTRYRGHPVLIFPLFCQSIYQFMSFNHHKPFCYSDVIDIMWQMCCGVEYMHSLGIINTDLKPENIVLVNDEIDKAKANWFLYSSPKSTQIKVIDFGSSVIAGDRLYSHLIQTRHYRAPEVVFRLDWSFAADIWSMGCILVELINGKMLYNTHCSIDHLQQMVRCIGSPPSSMLQLIDDDIWNDYFNSDADKATLNMMKATISRTQCSKLNSYFGDRRYNKDCAGLYNLCRKMLCWDPKKRITAEQALQHPVFKDCN